MQKLTALALLGTLGLARTAAAETPPTWCANYDGAGMSAHAKDALTATTAKDALPDLVVETCGPDAEARTLTKELAAARAKWSKALDMTEADWADAVDYTMLTYSNRTTNAFEVDANRGSKRAWSTFDPIDQYAMLFENHGVSRIGTDSHYVADALGAKLTETGRLGYISRCLTMKTPVQWAMCQADLEKLDPTKLAAELHATKTHTGADRTKIRLELLATRPRIAARAAEIQKLVTTDPGFAKVFELAKATRAEWDTRTQTSAELLGLMSAMEDAIATNSTKAFAGCEAKTWAAWQTAVGSIPATAFPTIASTDYPTEAILNRPEGYLAAAAMVSCMSAQQKQDALVHHLAESMSRWSGHRGPRTGTQTAIMAAGITFDDRDTHLEYPDADHDFATIQREKLPNGWGTGVIATATTTGDKTTVTFKKQLVKQEQCAAVKSSNKITGIGPSGQIYYETWCVAMETITVDQAPEPQDVIARYTALLKPGMQVALRGGFVQAAWAKPGAKLPSIVFGVAVK